MNSLIKFLVFLVFVSCTTNLVNKDEVAKIKISSVDKNSSILLSERVLDDNSFIIDNYPIPGDIEIISGEYTTKRPKQLFSAAAMNEIRLHKLGEVRWVYLGLEPSTVWPMILEFFDGSESLNLGNADPSSGILSSKPFSFKNQKTKVELKIEPGLQQSSSEIFVSHLGSKGELWEIIPNENSNLDAIVNELYDFLSSTSPTSGTSLLALNLNTTNKTEVITNALGLREIKLKVNFARAWASTRRSLILSGFKIIDEDRNEGKFYLEYENRRSIFNRTPSFSNVQVLVSESKKGECTISTNLGEENIDISEDIISQINQALS
tara:strand:- start:126 stop:1091 length:966 start_codon:yes stop_codon:yes gene_type:complete